MAEKVKTCGVKKESGYLYYLDKQGDVSRSKMARAGKGGGNAEKIARNFSSECRREFFNYFLIY